MTEHSQPRNTNWFWFLMALCACGLVGIWAVQAYVSVTTNHFGSLDSVGEEDPPTEEPGDVALATDQEKATGEKTAGATSAGEKKSEAEKPPLGQVTVLIPTKKFRKEGPNKAPRVTFDDIDIEKVLNTKQLSVELPAKMPEWLKNLDGQRVRLKGYMHPGSAFQAEGIKRFIFCRDTSACCFGPDPTIYYLIMATLKSGTSTDYIENKAFDVEGVFRIDPIVSEKAGKIAQFYHLDDAQIVKR